MNVVREIQYPFYIFLVRSPASLHHIPFHSIIHSLSGLSPQSPLFIISFCIKTSMASHCLLRLLGFKAFLSLVQFYNGLSKLILCQALCMPLEDLILRSMWFSTQTWKPKYSNTRINTVTNKYRVLWEHEGRRPNPV